MTGAAASLWRAARLLATVGVAALPVPVAASDEQAELKAAFIYRFAQYTRWPPPPPREFQYCLAGAERLREPLMPLARRPQGLVPARLQVIQTPQQASECQVVVLGFRDRAELQRWARALADEPVLTVGDSPEAFRAGATIVLDVEPDGLSFRVNLADARRRGLALSAQVLKLAREVR